MTESSKSRSHAAALRPAGRDARDRGGRADDLEGLFLDYREELIGIITARLGSRDEAGDIVQEVYLRLRNLDNPKTLRHPRAFFLKIARNIIIDRSRKHSTDSKIIRFEAINQESTGHYPSPEMIESARQNLYLIREAIGELPPKCRKAFILLKFRDFDYADIAAILGVSESMVRKYIKRALLHCGEKIRERGSE